VAHEVGDTLELDGEEDALVRAFQKAGRLYASLEEPKRREKIRQYCLRKGFSASQVDELLLESRQDD
jgi:1,2-diacylglycerol 3-alpha-glucosyltransferase